MKKIILLFCIFLQTILYSQQYKIVESYHQDFKNSISKLKIDIFVEENSILEITDKSISITYYYNGIKSFEIFGIQFPENYKEEDNFQYFIFSNNIKAIFDKTKNVLFIEKYKKDILQWRNTFIVKFIKNINRV